MATHPLVKFVRNKWDRCGLRWDPFVAIYYLTYACDFRCPYCADGSGSPYHRQTESAVPAALAMEILQRIRKHADHLVLTGGEPLLHPGAAEILGRLPALRFASVSLTTNGERLETFLPQIQATVSTLGISLDTLEERKADAWFGKGAGMLRKILENITLAAGYSGRRYDILISAVATPNNIEDLYAVYAYARQHGFQFSATPELHGIAPPEKLRQSETYRRFFSYLAQEKRKGGNIFGSLRYLEYMGGFKPFNCHPLTTVSITPQGDVLYPCLEIAERIGNILASDLDSLRQKKERAEAGGSLCPHACHSACALGLSLLMERTGGEVADSILQPLWKLRHWVDHG